MAKIIEKVLTNSFVRIWDHPEDVWEPVTSVVADTRSPIYDKVTVTINGEPAGVLVVDKTFTITLCRRILPEPAYP